MEASSALADRLALKQLDGANQKGQTRCSGRRGWNFSKSWVVLGPNSKKNRWRYLRIRCCSNHNLE